MPAYNAVPSKDQWKKDLGLATLFGNYKSPFPAMERLGKLIASYHKVPGRGVMKKIGQAHVVYLMYTTCKFIVKNNQRGADYAKEKMGGHLNQAQVNAVFALQTFLEEELMAYLDCDRFTLPSMLMTIFGREVTDVGKKEDAEFLFEDKDSMDWYQSDAARQAYKLSFRAGIAYGWRYEENNQVKDRLITYDTAGFGDVIENDGSLFVMDRRGRIYVNGQPQTMNLKHSSFMGGQAVQCAGGIRFDSGRLKWLSSKSGHYQPTIPQMVNMLERLRDYQVNLSNVIVYRENKRHDWKVDPKTKNVNVDFEPCKAMDLLNLRAWPTGVQPQSTHVTR